MTAFKANSCNILISKVFGVDDVNKRITFF